MNNPNKSMEQKQGGISKKRGESIIKGTDRQGTWGPRAPEPKSSNDDRRPGEARAPGGWKPALLMGRAGAGVSGAAAGAAHVHRRFPPERWNRDDDPGPVTGARKRARGAAPYVAGIVEFFDLFFERLDHTALFWLNTANFN
jgi:hypothetical protein